MTSSRKMKKAAVFILSWIFAGLIVVVALIAMTYSKSEGATMPASATLREVESPGGLKLTVKNSHTGVIFTSKNMLPINFHNKKIGLLSRQFIVHRKEMFCNKIEIRLLVDGLYINFRGIADQNGYRITENKTETLGTLSMGKEIDDEFINGMQLLYEEIINKDLVFFLNQLN